MAGNLFHYIEVQFFLEVNKLSKIIPHRMQFVSLYRSSILLSFFPYIILSSILYVEEGMHDQIDKIKLFLHVVS